MKSFTLLSLALATLLIAGCNSEIENKPAAEVDGAPAATPAATPAVPAKTTDVIRERSSIGFVGAKVTGDETGTFERFDGRLEYLGGSPSAVSFTIDPASVRTGKDRLDNHLRSSEFFDVEQHPRAEFRSTAIRELPGADGSTHVVEGVLDLRGEEQAISFPVKVASTADGVHATSQFTINRQLWGVSYPGAPDDLIKDEVLIKLDLWFPPPPPA